MTQLESYRKNCIYCKKSRIVEAARQIVDKVAEDSFIKRTITGNEHMILKLSNNLSNVASKLSLNGKAENSLKGLHTVRNFKKSILF